MSLRILGCSGGIGGENRTTSFLLGEEILIDAGTGLGVLEFGQLTRIGHVFLTHAHLDHIAMLPMLLDSIIGNRSEPVTVHATAATIALLQQHIFNWLIWPDFSAIPSKEAPILRYQVQEVGETHQVGDYRITALPAVHTVPAVGFRLDGLHGSLVYSGDTVGGDAFWQAVNQGGRLRALIIETAFPDRDAALAKAARHFCPATLAEGLQHLKVPVGEILITHLKPGDSEQTLAEVLNLDQLHPIRNLQQGEIIEF